jgi:two-component system CheB/CheR fusion protein
MELLQEDLMVKRAPRSPAEFLELLAKQTKEHAIIHLDEHGEIIWVNGGAEFIFGMSREDVAGKPVSILFPPEDVERGINRNEFATAAANGTAEDDRWMQRLDGSRFWASGNMIAIRDEQGDAIGFAKVLRNRTDHYEHMETLRNNNKSLQEASLQKDRFISTLAHELRNPLAPLVNAVDLIRICVTDKPEVEYSLMVIERQIASMRRLVDDLLDLTRIGAGKVELKKKTVAMDVIIGRALESIQTLIEEKGLHVETLLPDASMYVEVDADRMQQVFVNVLNNAAKYTPAGGRIWIKGTNEGNDVVIHIKDSGIGIPPDMQDRIFELFTQVESSRQESRGGLGIGLALVKQLVALHGGTVQARSDGSGKGSEFSVRLPLKSF